MTEAHNFPRVFSCIKGNVDLKNCPFSSDCLSSWLPPSFQLYARKYWSTKLSFFLLMTEAHKSQLPSSFQLCKRKCWSTKLSFFFLWLKLTTIHEFSVVYKEMLKLRIALVFSCIKEILIYKIVLFLVTEPHNYSLAFSCKQENADLQCWPFSSDCWSSQLSPSFKLYGKKYWSTKLS